MRFVCLSELFSYWYNNIKGRFDLYTNNFRLGDIYNKYISFKTILLQFKGQKAMP